MFKSNFAAYPYVSPVNNYGQNLGRAAKAFVVALFALDARKFSEDVTARSATAKVGKAEDLEALAKRFDIHMPNQAAELRFLAGR